MVNKTDLDTGGEFIRHLDGQGWAPVPRQAMDDTSLSLDARGALAWLLTRPDAHRLFVRYAQTRMCISQGRWQRIRRELESAGYLHVEKSRTPTGKWVWMYHLFDVPKPIAIGSSSIGRFCTGGFPTGGKPADKRDTSQRDTSQRDTEERDTRITFGDALVNASLRDALRISSDQNQKTITPPLPATQAGKAKASPKPKPKSKPKSSPTPSESEFEAALARRETWVRWLENQVHSGRPVTPYWRRKCARELEHIHSHYGWDGVDEVVEYATDIGYRGFEGWTDDVLLSVPMARRAAA